MPAGYIAGVAVGSVLVTAAFGTAGYYVYRRRHRVAQVAPEPDDSESAAALESWLDDLAASEGSDSGGEGKKGGKGGGGGTGGPKGRKNKRAAAKGSSSGGGGGSGMPIVPRLAPGMAAAASALLLKPPARLNPGSAALRPVVVRGAARVQPRQLARTAWEAEPPEP